MRTLTQAQVRDRGLTIRRRRPRELPDEGFRANPANIIFRAPTRRWRGHERERFLTDALSQPPEAIRRFLSPADREALSALRWADVREASASYGTWIRRVLRTRSITSDANPAGALPPHLLNRLSQAAQPRIAMTFIRARTLRVAEAASRRARGSALTAPELSSLQDRLAASATRWYVRRDNPKQLRALLRNRDGYIAVDVASDTRFGRGLSGGVANEIRRVTWQADDRVPLARWRPVDTDLDFSLFIRAA